MGCDACDAVLELACLSVAAAAAVYNSPAQPCSISKRRGIAGFVVEMILDGIAELDRLPTLCMRYFLLLPSGVCSSRSLLRTCIPCSNSASMLGSSPIILFPNRYKHALRKIGRCLSAAWLTQLITLRHRQQSR